MTIFKEKQLNKVSAPPDLDIKTLILQYLEHRFKDEKNVSKKDVIQAVSCFWRLRTPQVKRLLREYSKEGKIKIKNGRKSAILFKKPEVEKDGL